MWNNNNKSINNINNRSKIAIIKWIITLKLYRISQIILKSKKRYKNNHHLKLIKNSLILLKIHPNLSIIKNIKSNNKLINSHKISYNHNQYKTSNNYLSINLSISNLKTKSTFLNKTIVIGIIYKLYSNITVKLISVYQKITHLTPCRKTSV